MPTEEEERVRVQVGLPGRQHVPEDERVDEEQQERVDERPEEAQHGSAVARLQVAHDHGLDQRAVVEQCGEVFEH